MAYSKITIEKRGGVGENAEERVGKISAELMKENILFEVTDHENVYVITLRGY